LTKYLPVKKRFNKDDIGLSKANLARRIRQVLEELGPTYIKLGQLLSTRADILPPQYIKELRQLQDRVPAVDFSQINDLLKEELGDRISLFKDIESEPQAAASIAQTHRAVIYQTITYF